MIHELEATVFCAILELELADLTIKDCHAMALYFACVLIILSDIEEERVCLDHFEVTLR